MPGFFTRECMKRQRGKREIMQVQFAQEPWESCAEELLKLRSTVKLGDSLDPLDAISWHTTARLEGVLVGGLRVTSALNTRFDFEDRLPHAIPMSVRSCVGSAGRLITSRSAPSTLMSALSRAAWIHANSRGKWMDIIAAPARLAPVYAKRFGYNFIAADEFLHTRTQRPVRLMTYVLSSCGQGLFDGPHLTQSETPNQIVLVQLREFQKGLRAGTLIATAA